MFVPKTVLGILLAVAACASCALGAEPPAPAPVKTKNNAAIEAQRQKIWNSAAMLRARAWLEDYFAASAKITPEEAQEYREHLQAMTPVQMKLWLLKFEEEEQQRKQSQAVWQQGRQAAVTQAEAAMDQQQQAAANPVLSGAALQEQQRMAAQRSLRNQMILQQRSQVPYGYNYPYGGYPYYGYGRFPW